MPIYYQSANPIPICGQSVNPLPIRQSLTNLPISDQSIYPMPTLDQADMTVFQPQPLHTHTHTSATTIKTTLSPVKSPILVNPMSMHLAIPYLHREQDLYAGPTIGLDGGWFHCNPSRQSAQPFSILDNICQSTANPGPTYQCNANLLNNANANATQSYQSIINLPTNALIHSTSQIH